MKTILITGGLGYIGSHTVIELLNKNFYVIIVDNLINSTQDVLTKIEQITNKKPLFYATDIRNYQGLVDIFNQHNIDAVIHFAALKAVGESVSLPLKYYNNNVYGSLVLLQVMQQMQVKTFIFSSSATVYGETQSLPIDEDFTLKPANAYGRTKMVVEQMLQDVFDSDSSWNIGILRYFNPVGAHNSGLIGENPNGIPNNLMPYICQVARKKLTKLNIYGNDYPTIDGTGVRDYIHIMDLVEGHIRTLEHLAYNSKQIVTLNLGTGYGYSVLEVIAAFEKANNITINYEFAPRRHGDIAKFYANPTKALELLNWQTKFSLIDMCKSSWLWTLKNS